MGKSRVVDVLVFRDRVSREVATNTVNNCCKRLEEEAVPNGDYNLAEEIIADELGLEPDYMMDLIDLL